MKRNRIKKRIGKDGWNMKKIKNCLRAAAAIILFLFSTVTAAAAGDGYTYTYDYWGDIQYSPDAYSVLGVYTAVDLGLTKSLSNPCGLFAAGDMIYLCDTGNNRIIEISRTGPDSFELNREITDFRGDCEVTEFSGPADINVTEDGFLYICDKGNNRIVKLDSDLNYCMEFVKPADATFDQSLSFLPDKLAVDSAGRVYCIADNVNKGLIKFEADGSFNGFVGASEVTFSFSDYIWKKLATKEQRAALESFVPTEYDNVYLDSEGFFFACTTNISEATLNDESAKPIRRLNLMGKDILIKNGSFLPIGDIQWDTAGGYSGPSLITDVTALNNQTYIGLDKVRGRLFAYDEQGRLLFAFGGSGNMDGRFKLPAAVDHLGYDLLVLDSQDCSLTVFTPTEYGQLIYRAMEQYTQGDYLASGQTWEEVRKQNGNYDLAYIGIGRALLRQEQYQDAMKYFRLAWDDDNYSKAFQQYRKEWVEDHIAWIFGGVFLILLVPLGIGRIRKVKREIDGSDLFRTRRHD